MNDFIRKAVVKVMTEAANHINSGNCELSDEEGMELLKVISHRPMSKEQACLHLNLSRSRFDDLVRERKIPKGRKRLGFKELCWYEDELNECKKRR